MTGHVGIDLRHARERLQLSLEDLSARTKIRPALLDMIEREEFDRLPAGILTRGFLRAYARAVGLEPEAIVRRYVEEFEPERPVCVTSPPGPEDVEWDSAQSGRTRWFLAPAIPLALAAIFFVRMYRPVEVAAVPPVAAATPIGTAGEPSAPEPARLRIDVRPSAPVWVEASADGAPVLRGLVDAGQTRTIEGAAEIALRVGDAGAFSYSINGRPGRALGGAAQVRDVRITHANYTEFLSK